MNMNIDDAFRNLTVKVNNGSGCLFQTGDEEHTYVLTARHNLADTNSIEIKRILLAHDSCLTSETLDIIGEPYFHDNINIDAAICKVKKVTNLPYIKKCDFNSLGKEDFYLCGHPEVRGVGDSFRLNKLNILNSREFGYIEGELTPVVNQGEVSGQSGGGIFYVKNGTPIFIGIQKGMAIDDEIEALSRIKILPYKFFDDIVSKNSEDLSKLSPSFLTSFNEIIKSTYTLNNLPINKELIQSELHANAQIFTDSISPRDILNCLGFDKLLIKDEPQSSVYDSQLWIGMLELLIMIQINKNTGLLSIDDISNMNKKTKLMFGTVVSSWHELISSLYQSDLTELDKGGKIFVVTPNDTTPSVTSYNSDILMNIANVSPKKIKVSHAITSPFKDIELRHIYDLQKTLIENMNNFINANAGNIEDLLKNEAKNIV